MNITPNEIAARSNSIKDSKQAYDEFGHCTVDGIPNNNEYKYNANNKTIFLVNSLLFKEVFIESK
jgi:hypothetical protein